MKEKKSVLFVAPNLRHGGAESVLVKILNNIDLSKYDVKLALLEKEGSHLSRLNNDIPVINLNSSNVIGSLLNLKRLLKKENPDIVYSIIGHLNIMLALLKFFFFKNITFIGRENAVYSEFLFKEKTLKKRLLTLGYKLFLNKLDFIVVQSKFMSNQIQEYFNINKNKIYIFNNPIEYEKIQVMSKETLNDNWHFDKINLIGVGRIEKVKNYYEMIDIIEQLPSKFHLNIFGEGSEKGNLIQYIEEKKLGKKVTLHGFETNPYKYMKNSFALLLTSTRESFPNVVLEANACGTYVMSYNMPGGISEIIINGKNGKIIGFGDKDQFINSLTHLVEIQYDSADIKEIAKNYTIDKYMDKLYDLFDRV